MIAIRLILNQSSTSPFTIDHHPKLQINHSYLQSTHKFLKNINNYSPSTFFMVEVPTDEHALNEEDEGGKEGGG